MPRTPFNTSISSHRVCATSSLPLHEVRVLAKSRGVTINDVVLAQCAGALRRYLAEHAALPDAWLKRLTAHAAELLATGAPIVLAGDTNVVPTDLDIYPTKSWDRDALLQPESRDAYRRLVSQGWTDAV